MNTSYPTLPIIIDEFRFYSLFDAVEALNDAKDALNYDDLSLYQERLLRGRIEALEEELSPYLSS